MVFIGKTEAIGACASHLVEQLRMESDALKAKLAPPVADRSVLSKQLGTLSSALSRAENERRQQGESFDRELRAIKARLVKMEEADAKVAAASAAYQEANAKLQAQFAAPAGSVPDPPVPNFKSMEELVAYISDNAAIFKPILEAPAGDSSVPAATVAAATTPSRTEATRERNDRSRSPPPAVVSASSQAAQLDAQMEQDLADPPEAVVTQTSADTEKAKEQFRGLLASAPAPTQP